MQTWPYLPRLDSEAPTVQAALKRDPEDFLVEEIPAYRLSGDGQHLFLRIEKRDVPAEGLLKHLARSLGVPQRDIGAAGMKDRRAITRQWVSVPAEAEARVERINTESIRVLEVTRHKNKLKTGHLAANRFTIHARGIPSPIRDEVCEAARRVGESGFPNYFGPQRFGREGNTAKQGLDLLKGQLRTGDLPRQRRRFLIRLAISAAQSMVFNTVLANRISDGRVATVFTGDVLQKTDSGGLFLCENPAVDQLRLEAGELALTGPMHGPKMRQADGEPAAWDDAGLQRWKLTAEQFEPFSRVAHGTRRPLLVRATDLNATPVTGGVRFTFTLPPGVYATVLLREIIGLEA
ncbi:MAG: tRNA pseudouridine(13) synthase TruD [Planctomycetaceae bacterium]